MMHVVLNGKKITIENGLTVNDLRKRFYPDSAIAIVNAVPVDNACKKIAEHDRIQFISRGEAPSGEQLDELLFARQPFVLTEKLKNACVGIAGAGGLGTVVAETLARAGVGALVVADFDVVEPSNLNRQRFSLSQLGMPKVEALAENIRNFNPFVRLVHVKERVTALNCSRIFAECSVVAECFDSPEDKAEIVAGLHKRLPRCAIVAASGLAGIEPGSTIQVRKISDRLYVVGDMVSDVAEGTGLFATRVGIAAALQSHVIIRLILGVEE